MFRNPNEDVLVELDCIDSSSQSLPSHTLIEQTPSEPVDFLKYILNQYVVSAASALVAVDAKLLPLAFIVPSA